MPKIFAPKTQPTKTGRFEIEFTPPVNGRSMGFRVKPMEDKAAPAGTGMPTPPALKKIKFSRNKGSWLEAMGFALMGMWLVMALIDGLGKNWRCALLEVVVAGFQLMAIMSGRSQDLSSDCLEQSHETTVMLVDEYHKLGKKYIELKEAKEAVDKKNLQTKQPSATIDNRNGLRSRKAEAKA